ncbi:aspartate aminotransferase family protein [Paraburkholderia terrae]|uniref:Aspartate aminotransferase family protein n=1 Tax=Paraburkholderia terrae TaxID=311230 RepID=A0ABN6JKH1_9BURK|nr:aspartate aminotransferase family protein [Paraburkholderia terrae]MDW3662427.1 aspartate aminotransferase family protein [Paraburkholderia terrae]BCZ80382.1 aspartate aminotransferase family protein [Paraburkholderia terrae]BDC41153.1 aspartate aminotransferase family protein [Paraburkholderia terrae]
MTSRPVIDDLSNFWMPFTANRQFKSAPRLLESAKGMYYRSTDGRDVLDACAGLWCVNAGHGRDEIVAAVQKQAATLDFAPTFQMGHPLAFEAASKVAELMPEGLDRVFFTNSGSESVDTALKIALAYHRARGEGQRTRLIGRERGYHGVGFGGISVGGIAPNRKTFSGALLPSIDHLPHTHNLEHNAFSKGQPAWGAHLADELERIVALHDASTIAAVIVEPVAGSTGVLIPPQGYLQKLRDICTKHGILLIFDEVITGFGRLGAATASEYFGVKPDLLTMAKAINNASVPMGAVAASRTVHDTIVNAGAQGAIELFHGYTYSAHPLAAAACVATLDLYRSEGLFERAASMAPKFEAAVHALRDAKYVKDIRNLGMVAGIELEPRDGAPGARAYEAFVKCFEAGVLIRFTGDILAFSPPLIIDEAQIDQIFQTVRNALASIQ